MACPMAARSIASEFLGRSIVAQLTFLEPAAFYHRVHLRTTTWPRGRPRRKVENYRGRRPERISGQVVPPMWASATPASSTAETPWLGVVMPTRSGHLDIVRWYVATAENPRRPSMGFNASVCMLEP